MMFWGLIVGAEGYLVASLVPCCNLVRHPSPAVSAQWCEEDRVETAEVNSFVVAQEKHPDFGQPSVAYVHHVCRKVIWA